MLSFLIASAAGAAIISAIVYASTWLGDRERPPGTVAVCHECFETYFDLPAWETEGFVCNRCRKGGRKIP